MSNHNIYLIAYPSNSLLEERIEELLMNYYDNNDEEDIFGCGVKNIPSNEITLTMSAMLAAVVEEEAKDE